MIPRVINCDLRENFIDDVDAAKSHRQDSYEVAFQGN